MITIVTTYTFNSLITATLLKLLLRSSHTEIVQEVELNSSQLYVNTHNYHLEHILHEYERKYGQITLLHKVPQLWKELQVKIDTLCQDHQEHLPLTKIISIIEEIITDEEPFFKTKNLIRQLEQLSLVSPKRTDLVKI